MDAAARAELAALRRRAYDRDADIAGDEVALERLSELEGLALAARSEAAPAPSWTAGTPGPEASTPDPFTHRGPASDAGPTADGPATGRPSPRRLLIVGLVASVTLFAAALGAVDGAQTVPDPIRAGAATTPSLIRPAATDLTANGRVSIPLLVDRVRGEFIDVSSRPDAPMFPANGVTMWAQPLGVHYGWALWVARVSSGHGPQNCLLLTDGAATEVQCTPHDATAERAVGVSLAFDKLAEDQRPPGMTPDQQVTFGWGGAAYMTMEINDS
ncbi:hypothetical protein [Microbacterium trichothecenolyticum]|uniref:Uncharacterized protein n=1 Tax=Microbacterium trichothecenolyticum TaxID=69370 RepID=A0A0M2HKQ0_MICTR|nr:hypothetical protein [Microbacterium trichothecenolyticum]KJL45460.1 hypothetical protein RS82_00231 [Microbacterium trichothecenolyticum]